MHFVTQTPEMGNDNSERHRPPFAAMVLSRRFRLPIRRAELLANLAGFAEGGR